MQLFITFGQNHSIVTRRANKYAKTEITEY